MPTTRFQLRSATATVAVALLFSACSGAPAVSTGASPQVPPTTTAPSTPPASVSVTPGQPIADGTYLTGAQSITAFKAEIDADTTLTAADKKRLLADPLFSCNTQFISLDFHAGQLTQSESCDGGPMEVGTRATYAFRDDRTLVIQETCCGTSSFALTLVKDGFFLKLTSPVVTGPDTGVFLFEASPFMLVGAAPRAIPDGKYGAPDIGVPDLIKQINADAKATAAEKRDLIHSAFRLDGHSTYGVEIDLADGHFAQSDRLDGELAIGARGTFAFPDASTIVWQELTLNRFQVSWAKGSFMLKLIGAPNYASAEDALAAKIFWASPFSLVP
jgi:hypothetical protein